MIIFPDTALETLPPPEDRDWWIMATLGTPPCALLAMCKVTKQTGVVWNPTPEELTAAAGDIEWKYKLEDAARVEIKQTEGGGDE